MASNPAISPEDLTNFLWQSCIAIHVKKCFEAGATKEEIAEVLGVAILMGGGPALTHSAFVAQAIEEFAPKA